MTEEEKKKRIKMRQESDAIFDIYDPDGNLIVENGKPVKKEEGEIELDVQELSELGYNIEDLKSEKVLYTDENGNVFIYHRRYINPILDLEVLVFRRK